MAPFNGVPTHEQQVALALAPKIAASLSILGSSYIIADVWRKRRRTNTNTAAYHRLLIGLSITDLLMSIGLFTSTWAMPADTQNVVWARGNTQTCTFIGFIEQAGVATVMYNASLSFYYLVRIKHGYSQTRIQKYCEPWMHAIPIGFGLTTMVLGLILKSYNSGLFDCWIAPFPQGCDESWRTDGGDNPCIRGNNASLYQWIWDVIPKWTCVLIVTINMALVHRSVLNQERSTLQRTMRAQSIGVTPESQPSTTSTRRRGSSSETLQDDPPSKLQRTSMRSSWRRSDRPSTRLARRLARQSYLYVGALYITYIPVIVTRSFELANGYVHYEMLLTISITIPLQGLWNVLVYLRPRYLAKRDARKKRRALMERTRAAATKKQGEEESGPESGPESSLSGDAPSSSSGKSYLPFRWDFLRTVSEVVQEGGLDNEEQEEESDEQMEKVDEDCEIGNDVDEAECQRSSEDSNLEVEITSDKL